MGVGASVRSARIGLVDIDRNLGRDRSGIDGDAGDDERVGFRLEKPEDVAGTVLARVFAERIAGRMDRRVIRKKLDVDERVVAEAVAEIRDDIKTAGRADDLRVAPSDHRSPHLGLAMQAIDQVALLLASPIALQTSKPETVQSSVALFLHDASVIVVGISTWTCVAQQAAGAPPPWNEISKSQTSALGST